MRMLGVLSALFAGLNGIDDFQNERQKRRAKIRLPHSRIKRTKGAYYRSQRIRANRRKNKK